MFAVMKLKNELLINGGIGICPSRKILYCFLILLAQCGILIGIFLIYNYIFRNVKPDLSLGISYHYYFISIFPIIALLGNFLTFISIHKTFRIFQFLLLMSGIIYYWFGACHEYPYRISFLIISSIGVLYGGSFILHKLTKKMFL